MNMTWSLSSRMLAQTNKTWKSALRGACERIRIAHGSEICAATPRPQAGNAEILGAAQRIREEFKSIGEGNANMLQALADFKNRRRRLRCEHGLIRTTGLTSVPRP